VKVRVLVTRKEGVLDPEGRALRGALRDLGYASVQEVDTGKVVTLDLAESDPEKAKRAAIEMCGKLLANPVIEQYSIEVLGT